jgi:hypothetical protein
MRTALRSTRAPSTALMWVLRIVIAAGLAVDAVVHLRLASEYQMAFPQGVGGGTLFRVEAAAAGLAAVAVLVWANRRSYLLALAVAASAFLAVLLTRYVEVPAVGPLPSMYEPVWFFEKSLSAGAEALAALAAVAAFVISPRPSSRHKG